MGTVYRIKEGKDLDLKPSRGVAHDWGEEDFDWDSLYAAETFIWTYCLRWGRVGMHTKEKYGQLRVSVWPFNGSFYSIIWPGYVSNQYRWKWMWRADNWISWRLMRKWPLHYITSAIIKYQFWVIKCAYRKAIKRWPHIRDEILSDVPFYWE